MKTDLFKTNVTTKDTKDTSASNEILAHTQQKEQWAHTQKEEQVEQPKTTQSKASTSSDTTTSTHPKEKDEMKTKQQQNTDKTKEADEAPQISTRSQTKKVKDKHENTNKATPAHSHNERRYKKGPKCKNPKNNQKSDSDKESIDLYSSDTGMAIVQYFYIPMNRDQ